ncbi:hypothetical protein [Haliscomenobacter sp.]|uniref:hypothetical protein n=1 Tax=Haliscomenobacter sp. TaxID=2717303 RepID=UPI003594293F
MLISVADASFTGKVLHKIDLEFATEWVSVKDIITARVNQEVEEYNQKQGEFFRGLVIPTEAEQTLNGYKLKDKKRIDAEKQVYVALHAFQNNGYFVLIDDVQSEDLEQKVQLKPDTSINFVKLTPLVGG